MSTPIEFESPARQDFGPTTSASNFEPLLVHKLADGMSIPSVDVPPQATPSDVSSEPDSTFRSKLHDDYDTKIDEYVITDSNAVRAVHADAVACGPYAVLDREDTDDGSYAVSSAVTPTIVQSFAKIPQSYTLNVDATVTSIATIQSAPCVSSSSQMLLLPTILAAGAPADSKPLDGSGSPPAISQIILTSDAYATSFNQPAQRTSILPETNYITRPKSAKVQILSNISLPKTTSVVTYSPYIGTDAPLYNSSEQVYKLNTGVATIHSKHLNHSVAGKPKNPASVNYPNMTSTVISQAHIKNVGYAHTITKGINSSKTLNKVNNGTTAGSVAPGTNQCHILSRVVSGPKLAVQPGRKGLNTFGKSVKSSSQNTAAGSAKSQSRSIKIMQQGATSKAEMKSWNIANANAPATYGVEVSGKAPQKSSPTHKTNHPLLAQKSGKNEQRVVLQSPCGPVLISTAPISISHHRTSHYVQSGAPSLRYVHNYVQQPTEVILPTLTTSNQISANQHLTAQILQSLSQPIGIAQPCPSVMNQPEPFVGPPKPVQHRRHISGDPTTLLTADDFIGMEERPNLSEEIVRYTHDTVAFVMLDHTYALSAQKLSPVPTSAPASAATAPPILSPVPAAAPPSPVKGSPPAVSSTVQINDFHIASSTGPPLPSSPVAAAPSLASFTYKSTVLPPKTEDDDAASAISSTDGRAVDHAGSDTETAPEVDDGKTRCICDFTHDDGYMICCDRCGEWQHVDCMGIDRNNIPDAYQCSECQPRKVERRIARILQMRKREEFGFHGSGSESSDGGQSSGIRRKRLLTVTTYSDTSGACITTYNNLPVPLPQPSLPQPKRIPVRRPKKTEIVRKGSKRKLTEKRVKRKKDMMMNRSKYSSLSSSQSNWHDAYEQAVTNHYSPELRAKIMRYGSKVGNAPNMTQAISAHYCTTVPHAGGKILIATRDLQENTPIVELRGKYMLSTQHRPQLQVSSRVGGQKPGPFVFFYRLPKDNTQVCIDTRTYGNEARFVRRSCKYNAELQHCIVKGTLHVYIVSLGAILDGTEITVPHDHSGGKQACACGNPKHCKLNGFNTLAARKAPVDYQPREKRSRHRRSSSSSAGSPLESPPALPPAPRRLSVINTNIKSPVKSEIASPIKSWGTTFTDAPISESIFKEEKVESEKEEKVESEKEEKVESEKEESKPIAMKSEDAVDSAAPLIKLEAKEELKKEEIEPEPKVEDVKHEIVKEFVKERLPPSPVKEIKEEKKVVLLPEIESDSIPMPEGPPPKVKEEEKVTRSVTAKPVCQERATRSSRSQSVAALNHDSMDEKTDDSQDKQSASKDKRKMTREERKMEAIMRAFERMEKAEQRKQEVRERQSKRRESDPVPPTDKEGDDDEPATGPAAKKRRQRKGRARTTSQNTSRRRLNSADSDMMTSGDEPHTSPVRDLPTPQPQPAVTSTTQDVNLSSACRLVEAAVGPLESAFKLPKTKKTMANEWLGRSPEHTPYQSLYRSPLMSERSLESLVRVASTMIGDLGGNTSEPDEGSPPRTRDKNRPPKKMKRGTSKAVVPEQPVVVIPQHSAKKRWLRQAISEESDSPTAESPPNEMVTPLKKRRLARESLSLDQPVIHKPEDASPPVTGSEDSPTKEDVCDSITRHCKMKSRYIDSMFGSEYSNTIDPQNVFLNLKDPRDEKFNLDIRRIIGVPGSEETYEDIPLPKTPEDRSKPIDVNENEFQHNTSNEEDKMAKGTPMEIDTDISRHLITDLTEDTSDAKTELDGQTEPITIHSNDTSGNSSPLHNEMDDIQKKIHSFHTENIQILKTRNKKPPKEKRKKVNLNFDLNMVDDQISIQLRTDASPRSEDMNGDVHIKIVEPIIVTAPDLIPLPPPVDSSKTNANLRFIPWTADIPLPAEPMRPKTPESVSIPLSEPVESESVKATPDLVEVVTDAANLTITDGDITKSEPVKVTQELVKVASEPIVVTDPFEVQPDSVKVQPDAVGMVVDCVEVLSKTSSPETRAHMSPGPVTSPTISPKKADQIITSTSEVVKTPNTFASAGLFSGIFNNMNSTVTESISTINENVPHINIIDTISKNIEGSVFNDKPLATPCDELRNVQEILDRVNSMDANTSMILSGVLNADVASKTEHLTPVKTYCPRSNDPRLNPQTADKPKPVRRKLSISEYLKRHKVGGAGDGEAQNSQAASDGADGARVGEWSSDSSAAGSRSPLRLDAVGSSASEEMEMRLSQALKSPLLPVSARVGGTTGEFDAQPTQLERQRENLSQRLRREFGLSLPEDEEARSATALQGADTSQPLHSETLALEGSSFSRPPPHAKPPRLDR